MTPVPLIATAALVCLAACEAATGFGPTPLEDRQLLQGQVRTTLTVTPTVVRQPDTVVAVLTYENLGWTAARLTSSYGCLSFASVYHGSDRVPFPSTDYGCLAVIATRDLVPGVPIRVEWSLPIGTGSNSPLAPGQYRFVADLNTADRDLVQTFTVF